MVPWVAGHDSGKRPLDAAGPVTVLPGEAAMAEPLSFRPGERVVAHSLASEQFNGREGIVQGGLEGGRHSVLFASAPSAELAPNSSEQSPTVVVKLKPTNLRPSGPRTNQADEVDVTVRTPCVHAGFQVWACYMSAHR